MPDSSYTDELPLNSDSRWWSIDLAFELLMARLRSTTHALRDLEEALAQGRLRCMVRSIDTGERKRVAAVRWTDRISLRRWGEEVEAVHRGSGTPYRNWSFYIWSPDYEVLWPADPSFPIPATPAPKRRESWFERVSRMSDEAVKDYSPPWPSVVSEPPKSGQQPPSLTPVAQAQARLRDMKSLTGVEKRWLDFKKITDLQYREFRQAVKDERVRRKKPPAKS